MNSQKQNWVISWSCESHKSIVILCNERIFFIATKAYLKLHSLSKSTRLLNQSVRWKCLAQKKARKGTLQESRMNYTAGKHPRHCYDGPRKFMNEKKGLVILWEKYYEGPPLSYYPNHLY